MQGISDKLTLLKTGAKSELHLYRESFQNQLVLKSVCTSESKECGHLRNEYTILSALNHPNIIEAFQLKKNVKMGGTKKDVLALEYASHGSLLEFLRTSILTIPQKRWVFLEICQGVKYLHQLKIVHRDLKLDNLLITEDEEQQLHVKIGDFGFATKIEESKAFSDFKGTRRGYMAPEIHRCLTKNEAYDAKKADCFALGVILFAITCGRLPFEFADQNNKLYELSHSNPAEFWFHHRAQLPSIGEQEHQQEQFKNLFLNLVQSNVQNRISVKEAIQHEWFQGKKFKIQKPSSSKSQFH